MLDPISKRLYTTDYNIAIVPACNFKYESLLRGYLGELRAQRSYL
jgi:hypothetical protein